jgi:hypothetical protein
LVDTTIDNNGTLSKLHEKLEEYWEFLNKNP